MGATDGQMSAATAALEMTWQEITELCRQDLARYGVLPLDRVQAMPGIPAAGIRLGDVVAVFAHQRYRAARVWKVGSKNVSAFYLTPTHLDESARHGRTLYPNNISGVPAGLIARRTDGNA